MRWIRAHIFLIAIYGCCLFTGGTWLSRSITYQGVQNWPTVKATIVDQHENRQVFTTQYWNGAKAKAIGDTYVAFEYTVDGRTFVSDRSTPDGGSAPLNPLRQEWKAYYNPSSPDIAVLAPIPYQGTGWLLATLVSGVLIGIHLLIVLPDALRFFRARLASKQRDRTSRSGPTLTH